MKSNIHSRWLNHCFPNLISGKYFYIFIINYFVFVINLICFEIVNICAYTKLIHQMNENDAMGLEGT